MGGPIRAFIEGSPSLASSTAAQTAVSNSSIQILAANAFRKGLIIQNTGTTVLKLNFGTGTVTQTVYHLALSACTAADDGLGAAYFEGSWVGPVQMISSAVGGTCVITELTTGSPNWNLSGTWGTAML